MYLSLDHLFRVLKTYGCASIAGHTNEFVATRTSRRMDPADSERKYIGSHGTCASRVTLAAQEVNLACVANRSGIMVWHLDAFQFHGRLNYRAQFLHARTANWGVHFVFNVTKILYKMLNDWSIGWIVVSTLVSPARREGPQPPNDHNPLSA
ncbi:hypothetical protein DFP72DRAFT_872799 [Ephemerocybe angulata]|uniref:Uncharacterized protein n=1 Tax=Ephemerocybe angulata TaxID=980116 RepID=A0A8H6MCM3_9AGAR|nr:hypothetical protein DFP72DRAFT_872799 [Tulosesus angulatus]